MTYRLQTQGDWTNHVLWAAWSRRSELSSRGWDEVVEVLRRNREAYPWEGRRDVAMFRGAHDQLYAAAGIGSFLVNRSADPACGRGHPSGAVYGRSCWDGEAQGVVRHQDSIRCGRPRLLWMAQHPSNGRCEHPLIQKWNTSCGWS